MRQQILPIDECLRATLDGLQVCLGVAFDQSTIQRVFSDAEYDQVSYKSYSFYKEPSFIFGGWAITGIVEEYEPETIFLIINGSSGKQQKFDEFFASQHNSSSCGL